MASTSGLQFLSVLDLSLTAEAFGVTTVDRLQHRLESDCEISKLSSFDWGWAGFAPLIPTADPTNSSTVSADPDAKDHLRKKYHPKKISPKQEHWAPRSAVLVAGADGCFK